MRCLKKCRKIYFLVYSRNYGSKLAQNACTAFNFSKKIRGMPFRQSRSRLWRSVGPKKGHIFTIGKKVHIFHLWPTKCFFRNYLPVSIQYATTEPPPSIHSNLCSGCSLICIFEHTHLSCKNKISL